MPIADSAAHKDFSAGVSPATTPPPAASTPTPSATPAATPAAPAAHAASAAPSAAATGATLATPAATAAAAREYASWDPEKAKPEEVFEAMLDGKPFRLPLGIQLPYQRNGNAERVYRPFTEFQRNHINLHDYRAGKERLAAREAAIEAREHEAQLRQAQYDERIRQLEGEQERFLKSLELDPESPEGREYAEHLRLMRTSETYRKQVRDSRQLQLRDAEDKVSRELEQRGATQALVGDISSYIQRVCAHEKYQPAGLDPAQVQERYSQLLTSGRLTWPSENTPDYDQIIGGVIQRQVLGILDDMAAERAATVGPVQTELEAAKQRIAELEASKTAEAANANTRREMTRSASARAGAPAGGAPPARSGQPKDPPTGYLSNTPEARERVRNWVKAS